jgi:hypothetical protein
MAGFYTDMQRYVAWTSVGASTVRGMRTSGLVACFRRELQAVKLRRFTGVSERAFRGRLDDETELLLGRLPMGCRFWGLARKVLNIFLRSALYNTYLRAHYRLDEAEGLFELPLDSYTAKGLIRRSGHGNLPSWSAVRSLTPENSERYQQTAAAIADDLGVARVHLDITLWLERD